MHIFHPHQNDQPTGGNFTAPLGVGNGRLPDAEKVSQFDLRTFAGDELDTLHLSIEILIFHMNLAVLGLRARPTIDSQSTYNRRSIL